ncbi:hypothetical protein DYB37_011188 [Aphanomyces astaci]|uniref:DDE-1 domain-containing protein n=1 Tax=Aphanomyces astaci TaxID=112090 RepID=A0A3R7A904_APHAT|nr:hypothetical protein DYB35_008038 [Aphanomyces astaci]RHZ17467.1 hypothetical protein DYB37_011188 [Aphanomyces astaci]
MPRRIGRGQSQNQVRMVAKRMQNGKALKPKAKKLRDSLMTANKKWREEQGQSRWDETVQTTHLPTALVGSAVRNLPVTAKKTVELRSTLSTAAGQVKLPGKQLFYVVDDNDELIVRKYALKSIGLDIDRLLEQVAVRQIHEDGDNIGDPGADEVIAFGVSVWELRSNDKQLDVEAENLYKVATTSANAADQAQAAAFKQLQGNVVDAATKAVWGTKFRGTDLPANVKAMELRLKTDAHPYRCKPRKVHSTYTKPNDHDGRVLLEGFETKLWPKMQLLMQDKPTRIYGNPTAWCNDMLSIEFLRHHFGSREDMDKRVLMAWDSFSGHFTAGVEA